MSRFSDSVLGLVHSKRAAAAQGGLLDGDDPTQFNTADPLRLFIVQLGVIIMMTQVLGLVLKRMRQPRVIAEVLGGILLGPTAFGRIPGFTEHIFPQASRPYLALVADIGLCLFLFLVGLEIDGSVVKRNIRLSVTVGLAGMALPFGLGAALSVPLYHQFIDKSVVFTNFMLFTGVAYSITAFPVLCRILVELSLLDTTVGVVVLSAGVANDVVGWILLALAIGLVNGGGGLQALYILLTCVAFVLFVLFGLRRAVHWLARKTGSIENGPSVFFMTMVILALFGSAFFTDIIGVNAIFGAFLAGLIVPRDNGLALSIAEKMEEMVSVIFLPLYFTLSGLSTNLGLLDSGVVWGFTIAIMVLAYTGKMGGCTLAARAAGFSWREASTIGSLMSCKGLIELIVLNVGLSAGILSQRVFSMFVLEALVLTFMTTPAVVMLYPPRFRVRAGPSGQHLVRDSEQSGVETQEKSGGTPNDADDAWTDRVTVVLDKTEHVPGMMAITQLLHPSAGGSPVPARPVHVDALRLVERPDGVFSGVMKSAHVDELARSDALLGIFRTFGELHGVPVAPAFAVVPYAEQAASVAAHAHERSAQLVVLPWLPPWAASDGEHGEARSAPHTPLPTPAAFEFFRGSSIPSGAPSAVHAHFVRGVFAQAPCAVALFVDRARPSREGRAAPTNGRWHLLLLFFGGPDDRAALDLVVQLCADEAVSATVVRISRQEQTEDVNKPEAAHLADEHAYGLTVQSGHFPDTVYGQATTQTRLQSATADDLAFARYAEPASEGEPRSARVETALARVTFGSLGSPQPLHATVARVNEELAALTARHARLLVVAGRARRLAADNHAPELAALIDEHGAAAAAADVRKTVGDVTTALVAARVQAGVLVIQAATGSAPH